MKNHGLIEAALTALMAIGASNLAPGALYTYSYSDSGAIPQGGSTFSAEQSVSGIAPIISGLELILTFNDSTSLSGDSTRIQGHLNLGTATDSPFVNFYPVATLSSGANRIYDVSFSGASGSPGSGFDGLNPNSAWGLVLWDNGSGPLENGLVSWSLDITAVPEPLNAALCLFGVVMSAGGAARWYWVRRRPHRRAQIWPGA